MVFDTTYFSQNDHPWHCLSLGYQSLAHLGVEGVKNLEGVLYLGILREFCSQGKVL